MIYHNLFEGKYSLMNKKYIEYIVKYNIRRLYNYNFYLLKYAIKYNNKKLLGDMVEIYNNVYDIYILQYSVEFNNEEIMNSIISNNDFEYVWESYALARACRGNNKKIIESLIDKKGNSNRLEWCLQDACKGGNLDIVNYIISKGASNWDYGLLYACKSSNLDIIILMLRKGAQCWNSSKIFINACINGNLDIIKLMIKTGHNNNLNDGLIGAYDTDNYNVIKFLTKKGAIDINKNIYIKFTNRLKIYNKYKKIKYSRTFIL